MQSVSAEKNLVSSLTRRSFLGAGGLCLSGLAVPAWLSAQTEREAASRPFAAYADLLDTLRKRGHPLRMLGFAPDNSPIVGVKTGGTKKPAIFISAGAHSTEHAGVVAAVELIDRLQTKHAVWVIPTRDPIGLNGYRYALSLGLGEPPQVESLADAEALLRKRGVYWLDASQRGEGLNLVDFAARQYGPGFTIETGMRGPFHDRVQQHLLVVQTAVKLFEERYA